MGLALVDDRRSLDMAGLGLTRTEPCRSNNDVLNDNEPIDNRASLAILGGSPLLRPEEIKSVGRPDLPGYPLACGSVRLGARRQLRRCRDVHRLGVPDRCSSEAGNRFDQNITGFRAEEEIGFTADPWYLTGHFQRVTRI